MLRLLGLDSTRGSGKANDESWSVSHQSAQASPQAAAAAQGSSATVCDALAPTPAACSQSPPLTRKRGVSHDDLLRSGAPTKRAKAWCESAETSQPLPSSGLGGSESSRASRQTSARRTGTTTTTGTLAATCDMDRVRDVIQHQFGLEILHKHNELRLINQEMAKCQIALEQLRRCHLIPYPVNCPTPEQMIHIADGTGPAVAPMGDAVPPWAPPFGVVDGPYARHFAKWLIPDPAFGGAEAEGTLGTTMREPRVRGFIPEGRTTRNSYVETITAGQGRRGRGPVTEQKHQHHHHHQHHFHQHHHSHQAPQHQHQALPNGYPAAKDKAGPCILKRALDGQMVKLACLDCFRENFSSTQGFINHCRIAHKRDFKSHEEAAVACGHPVDSVIGCSSGKVGKLTAAPTAPAPTCVHPFSRQDMSQQDAYEALRSRISASLELYKQGKLPGVRSIPSLADAAAGSGHGGEFEPSQEAPHLSRLLRRRKFQGSLKESVVDAKIKSPVDEVSPEDDSEEPESPMPLFNGARESPARPRVVMRTPARSVKLPVTSGRAGRRSTSSNKGRATTTEARDTSMVLPSSAKVPIMSKVKSRRGAPSDDDLVLEEEEEEDDEEEQEEEEEEEEEEEGGEEEEDEDEDEAEEGEEENEDLLTSPNTLTSNNAPSLVSDDGEYDSDEGSSVSGESDNLDADSVDDVVAEISLDDEHEPRALRRGSGGIPGPVKIRKEMAKHVTFIGPVRSSTRVRRSRA